MYMYRARVSPISFLFLTPTLNFGFFSENPGCHLLVFALDRSFRNPRSPHSVVQYSDLRSKQLSPSNAKPPVPSPYYYSSKGVPYASDDGASKVKLTRLPGKYM